MKKVLVLGAGLVARPLVRYLLDKGHEVTCASRTVARAEALISGHENGAPSRWTWATRRSSPSSSPGPTWRSAWSRRRAPGGRAPLSDAGKNMVTTSYVAPEMAALDGEAREKGLTILNEIGVDPGIDHMSAMRIIDGRQRPRRRVVAFLSYCGGLPAPQHNDNPFGYKFSWAPRGVLVASRNGAQYLRDGRKVEVRQRAPVPRHAHPAGAGLRATSRPTPTATASATRASTAWRASRPCSTGARCATWAGATAIYNFLSRACSTSTSSPVEGRTYAQLLRDHLGCRPDEDLRVAFAREGRHRSPTACRVEPRTGWACSPTGPCRRAHHHARRLGDLMFERLAFAEGERDMIVMFHDFQAEVPRRPPRAHHVAADRLRQEGGDSAMSRTVSLPAAIAAHMILTGDDHRAGRAASGAAGHLRPVLDELATMGIALTERTETY